MLKLLLFVFFGNDRIITKRTLKTGDIAMGSGTNQLIELVEQNGGVVSIKEAKKILGPEVYERCWKEIEGSENWNHFCQNGDKVPTHICTSDWFYDWFCDKVDSALEEVGALSPRTKGLTVH